MRAGKAVAIVAAGLALWCSPALAQPAPAWSPQPWIEDLAQMRGAIETKYANLEWLLTEREFDLAGLFTRAEAALRNARDDTQARSVFDRVMQRIGDGHVGLSWPRPSAPAPAGAAGPPGPVPPATVEGFCRARGVDGPSPGLGPSLAGYVPAETGEVVPGGTARVGATRVGVLRIAKFEPGGLLSLCTEAVTALNVPLGQPCDEACEDRILTRTYRRLSAAVEERLLSLRAAGAEVLVVDLTGNGGGSEWVQAVARMLTPRRLVSQRRGFVRGAHWAGTWTRLGEQLRGFAATASAEDRPRLLAWAAEADAARAEAERTCPPTGGGASCPWVATAGYATGFVGSARAGEFEGREWAPWIFNPAQYPYRDGVWTGPVVVLVDDGTASAAEEMAAMLQDNRAAIILGSRTAGAGCGHTWGGTPTRLANSGAILSVPDCVRVRADGSNEVRGVIPDRLIGWRSSDGRRLRARMLEAALPDAIAAARALHRRSAP